MEHAEREVLELLAEGKVDVDEAERLLRALDAGERRGSRRPKPRLRRDLNQALASVQESLTGLGPQLKRAFGSGDSGGELDLDIDFELDDEPLGDPIELDGEALALPENSTLRVEHAPGLRGGGGDLELVASQDELLRIHGEGCDQLRAYRDTRGLAIRWRRGPLRVEVPGLVTETRVRVVGGDLSAKGVPGALALKAAGGDVELLEPSGDFRAKTAGGDLRLVLAAGWSGQGRVNSAGGDVEALVAAAHPGGRIEAKSVGGDVRLLGEFADELLEETVVGHRLQFSFGEGRASSRLRFKSVGGELTLERS